MLARMVEKNAIPSSSVARFARLRSSSGSITGRGCKPAALEGDHEQHGRDRERDDDADARPAPLAALEDAEREQCEPDDHERDADHVGQALRLLVAGLDDRPPRAEVDERAERQVGGEHPAPVADLDQQAAERRPDGRRERRGGTPDGDRGRAPRQAGTPAARAPARRRRSPPLPRPAARGRRPAPPSRARARTPPRPRRTRPGRRRRRACGRPDPRSRPRARAARPSR